jgi:CBS domain-containing protein
MKSIRAKETTSARWAVGARRARRHRHPARLCFLETIGGVDLEEDIVEDAMTPDTYAVAPDTPIGAVAESMARHRYGCAVVSSAARSPASSR